MRTKSQAQAGFSLLELIIVLALLVIIAAGIVLQVQTAHQRAAYERTETDLFQESREFMDQMSRDLRLVGYPNSRNYTQPMISSNGTLTDFSQNLIAAAGLVQADDADLFFEGGVDDSGTACSSELPAPPTVCVLFTQYHYDASTTNGCPCLKRSQIAKIAPVSDELASDSYDSEVQYVQNYINGNNVPIFRYYTNGGTVEVTPPSSSPLTYDSMGGSNAASLAAIDTIRVELLVQSPYLDLKTGAAPTVKLVSTVKVNNCAMSQVTASQLSCFN